MTTLVLEHLQHADSASPDITIDSSGRVGIGTTSPGSQLTVQGTLGDGSSEAYIDGWSIIGNRYQGNTMTKLNWAGGGARIQGFNSGVQKFEISANSDTYFNGGNVGIGTSSPQKILHTYGSGPQQLRVQSPDSTSELYLLASGTNTSYLSNSNNLQIWTNGGRAITVDASQNVGIGTVDPQAILDIKGNTTTYGGMSKIYLTDVSNHVESKNWAIGNGGSGFGHFTIGLSNAKDGDPMENGTHTTPLIIDETGKVALYSTTISNDAPFWAANIPEAQDSRMAFRIQPTRGSVNKGISIGAVGKNSSNSTGIQAYDTSSNTANTLELNPHGGAVTTPEQPSFLVYRGTGNYNISAGSTVSIIYDTADYNVGGHFNTSNYRFTAPVTGLYHFTASVNHYNMSSGTRFRCSLFKNGQNFLMGGYIYAYGGADHNIKFAASVKLIQGDYVELMRYTDGSATPGTSSGRLWNWFSGYLIG